MVVWNFYNFDSDLWTYYIVYILATNENPFTLSAERRGEVNDTLKSFAINDFETFIKLIHYDFSKLEKDLNINCFTLIKNYKNENKDSDNLSHNNVSDKIKELYNDVKDEADANAFYNNVMAFYKKYGVGAFGLYKADIFTKVHLVGLLHHCW